MQILICNLENYLTEYHETIILYREDYSDRMLDLSLKNDRFTFGINFQNLFLLQTYRVRALEFIILTFYSI